MERKRFICVAPSKEQFNVKGESLGMSGERALYYSPKIGSHRIYRSSYPLEPYIFRGKDINEDLELFIFDDIYDAQELCNEINEAYNDDFSVLERVYNG